MEATPEVVEANARPTRWNLLMASLAAVLHELLKDVSERKKGTHRGFRLLKHDKVHLDDSKLPKDSVDESESIHPKLSNSKGIWTMSQRQRLLENLHRCPCIRRFRKENYNSNHSQSNEKAG